MNEITYVYVSGMPERKARITHENSLSSSLVKQSQREASSWDKEHFRINDDEPQKHSSHVQLREQYSKCGDLMGSVVLIVRGL